MSKGDYNMVNLNDLQKSRTIIEQREFYNREYIKISNNEELVKKARLKIKQTNYKEFFEEFYYLMIYVELKYKKVNDNIKYKWCGRNQQNNGINYDGEIFRDKELIEKVEITNPFNSHEKHKDAELLNTRGYTECETGNILIALQGAKNQMVEILNQKSANQHYDNSITLVIVFDEFKIMFPNCDFWHDFLEETIKELKTNDTIFKEIYLLVQGYETSSENYEAQIYKIK